MKNNDYPVIRFAGFTDAWEQRKLGDYCFQLSATLNPQDSGDTVFVEYSMPAFDNGECPDIVLGATMKSARKILNQPCLLINKLNVRKRRIWHVENPQKNAVSSAEFVPICSEKWNLKFLKYIVCSDSFTEYLEDCSSGSSNSQKRVTPDVILSAKVILPEQVEQQKIGTIFEKVDNLVTLHQRKLDTLKNLKKTLLALMFPKNGENTPALRFAGFTDAWEQRKLGELADIVGGGTPSTLVKEYWGGDIDWYAPAEIGEQIFLEESQKKITKAGLQNSSAKMLPIGTVLFTSRAGIGNTAILLREGTTNQGFQSIVPHMDYLDSYFIFSRTSELKKYAEMVGAGSTFVEVSGKQMAAMPIKVPNLNEQKWIGDLFEKLDNLVTLHQRKSFVGGLDETRKGTHHEVNVFIFKFLNYVEICFFGGIHAGMS